MDEFVEDAAVQQQRADTDVGGARLSKNVTQVVELILSDDLARPANGVALGLGYLQQARVVDLRPQGPSTSCFLSTASPSRQVK